MIDFIYGHRRNQNIHYRAMTMAIEYKNNRRMRFAIVAPTKEEAEKAIREYKEIVFPHLEGANIKAVSGSELQNGGKGQRASIIICDDIIAKDGYNTCEHYFSWINAMNNPLN